MLMHSMAAFGLPYLTVSLVRIFANVWINDTSSLRTPLWLLWKFVAFWLINLWAKIMCYAMPTDSLAIVMMFGQVDYPLLLLWHDSSLPLSTRVRPLFSHVLYKLVQIFALQFATELLFISLSPFGWQFFLILALKMALNISAKGRLLEKLNMELDNWFGYARGSVTCTGITFLMRVSTAGARGTHCFC